MGDNQQIFFGKNGFNILTFNGLKTVLHRVMGENGDVKSSFEIWKDYRKKY